MLPRALRGLLALAVTGAAFALPVVVASPAEAASGACTRGTGVTVVVNSQVRCDATPGGFARDSFTGEGFALEDVPGQTGAVCRIDGFPSDNRCFETDAYWALFVSDPGSGTWRYASVGVNGQRVKAGTWVAFVWQSSATRTAPSVTPVGPAPAAPAPADPGTSGGGSGGGGTGGTGGGSGSPTTAPTMPGPSATPTESAAPTETPADGQSSSPGDAVDGDERESTSAEVAEREGGSVWGLLLAVVVIGLMGAAVVLVRRRRQGGA
ncbi:hypothetical protein [Aeromicrobium alkaliterrae]|uniref:DUF4430 domain-containing protein n=1 Tax=Aeromicrobium alkaliterrae TaxID=302168 RepID=A0ABN2JXU9_9ACTN